MSLANAIKAKRRAAIRRRLEHAWFLAVVIYALIRIFLADKFLAKYGLPIKPFAVVEIVSSMVYALASARFIGALVDNHNRKAGFFGLCTLVGFGAPDVFVIAASDHIPRSIYVVLVLIVLGTAVYTVRELRSKMRKARVQQQTFIGEHATIEEHAPATNSNSPGSAELPEQQMRSAMAKAGSPKP